MTRPEPDAADMTLEEFKATLEYDGPPSDIRPELLAMWYDGKGEWEEAHRLVQDEHSQEAAWVHAYLHRKEGDVQNASYWYRRCERPVCVDTLEREWVKITSALL